MFNDPALLAALLSGSFSPATLFASGEQGVWYDPSDFSTMFQDSAGTTPVTAANDPIGLVLDKSQGLALGSELVTNGDFSVDANWTKGAGWTISGGVASFSNATGTTLTQAIAFTSGKTYKITFDLTFTSGTGLTVALTGGGSDPSGTLTGSGTKTAYITATASRTTLQFTGVGGSVFSIDNVSVKAIAGNHASQSTSASRPVLQQDSGGRYYLSFDGTDDSLASSAANFSASDKAQVFAGVRKLSDAAQACVLAIGSGAGAPGVNNEQGLLLAPGAAAANTYYWRAAGSLTPAQANATGYTAPHTTVLTGQAEIAADLQSLRVNGATDVLGSGDMGTGSFGTAQILYIGRRSSSTLPFNGRIYGLVVRFGANLSSSQISSMETWMNGKTGAF